MKLLRKSDHGIGRCAGGIHGCMHMVKKKNPSKQSGILWTRHGGAEEVCLK